MMTKQQYKVLVLNDDGIDSLGLRSLALALRTNTSACVSCDVKIVAPCLQQLQILDTSLATHFRELLHWK
jgi:broad specificity polyphosphatase/5'/3'-nucleotidase SurE